MKLKSIVAAIVAAGFAIPMIASAGGAMKGDSVSQTDSTIVLAQAAEEKFKMLDINQDGVIDRDEAAADPDLATAFDQVDREGTGKITLEDFAAWEEVSEPVQQR